MLVRKPRQRDGCMVLRRIVLAWLWVALPHDQGGDHRSWQAGVCDAFLRPELSLRVLRTIGPIGFWGMADWWAGQLAGFLRALPQMWRRTGVYRCPSMWLRSWIWTARC